MYQQINLADNVIDIVQYLALEIHVPECIEVKTRSKRERGDDGVRAAGCTELELKGRKRED